MHVDGTLDSKVRESHWFSNIQVRRCAKLSTREHLTERIWKSQESSVWNIFRHQSGCLWAWKKILQIKGSKSESEQLLKDRSLTVGSWATGDLKSGNISISGSSVLWFTIWTALQKFELPKFSSPLAKQGHLLETCPVILIRRVGTRLHETWFLEASISVRWPKRLLIKESFYLSKE